MHHGGQWLREQVELTGMQKSKFAAEIGASPDTLRGWFNQPHPTPRRNYLVGIARLLNTTELELKRNLRGPTKSAAPKPQAQSQSAGDLPPVLLPGKLQFIPILNSISASAMVDHSGGEGHFDGERLALPLDDPGTFALVVEGDCMSPRYEHGDVVVFRLIENYEDIEDGRDYAVQYDADRAGESTFKRLSIDAKRKGFAVAQCINPNARPGAFPIDLRHVSKIGLAVLTVHK